MTIRWEDRACVIGVRALNEKDTIVELLTQQHGRIVSVAKFGATSKQRGIFHAGNIITLEWQARLPTQMGNISAEVERSTLPLVVNHPLKLLMMQSAHMLCHQFLHEHIEEPDVFAALCDVYAAFAMPETIASLTAYASFEHRLLNACGYGLDLERCAVTNQTHNLTYISPRTGRAVSREAGAAYHDKLFALPACYADSSAIMTVQALKDALHVTLHFMQQRLCADGAPAMPEIRYRLEARVARLL
jgi:DNA repair protein RecO (recombination protein O)